jgi:putative restriction endonuclease
LEKLVFRSEQLYAKYINKSLEESIKEVDEEFYLGVGLEKERLVKTRINQVFLRNAVLASYNNKCSITGIN